MLSRELDLKRFVYRQRMQSAAVFGLLSGRQNLLAYKMSKLVINTNKVSDSFIKIQAEPATFATEKVLRLKGSLEEKRHDVTARISK